MVVKGVNEISMEVVVWSVCLYCGLTPFDARIVEISSNVQLNNFWVNVRGK